ncbi:hypothetical protein BMS3Bbin02_00620 [bacterium BMS3Bbin02]|nr:hypothetical protein BMS3Bbin02_00620 [bacterium BMS3Bbin02]
MLGFDHLEQGCGFGFHECVDIARRDCEVGLGERHLDVRYERPEERPVLVHLCNEITVAGITGSLQTGTDTEPARNDLAGLGPSEHPRNSSKSSQADIVFPTTGTPRGPGSDLHRTEFIDGCRGQEVVDEPGIIDERPIRCIGGIADL